MPTSLFLIVLLTCEVLLYHATNLPIRIEVFPNHPFFVQRPSNFLGCASEGAIGCSVRQFLFGSTSRPLEINFCSQRMMKHTVKHRSNGTIFGEHAGSGPCGLLTSSRLHHVRDLRGCRIKRATKLTAGLTDSWIPPDPSVSLMAEFAPFSNVFAVSSPSILPNITFVASKKEAVVRYCTQIDRSCRMDTK